MSNLCIIPLTTSTRKRIPKKNIKRFLGKPIISYSIEAAIKSKIFTEVMVSTDDEEIVESLQKVWSKVPFFIFITSKKILNYISGPIYEVIE